MRSDQSDKADDADKTDGRCCHNGHQHQRFQAQKLQIDAQPDGAFLAQAQRGQLPHVARKQKHAYRRNRRRNDDRFPSRLGQAAEQPKQNLLRNLRRGNKLNQRQNRLKQKQKRNPH